MLRMKITHSHRRGAAGYVLWSGRTVVLTALHRETLVDHARLIGAVVA